MQSPLWEPQHSLVDGFRSTRDPNVIWVDLNHIDFAAEKPTKLKLTGKEIRNLFGDVTKKFRPAEPFSFEECPVKCPVECSV